MGCTTHQSEILVRPQHGPAMRRNFPAINGIAAICPFSSSYWYWKKICLFFNPVPLLFILSFFICSILHFLSLRSALSIYLISVLSFLSAAILQVFFISLFSFMSLLASISYISSFLYFILSSFLFLLSLILSTIINLEDLFLSYLSPWVRCNCKVLFKIITFFISLYDLWQPVISSFKRIMESRQCSCWKD